MADEVTPSASLEQRIESTIGALRWNQYWCGACGRTYNRCHGCNVGVFVHRETNHGQCGGHRNTPCSDTCFVALALAGLAALRQGNDENPRCAKCGGPHPFDTSLPSVRWNTVVRGAGLPEYLCLTCIVQEFAARGESFTATLWGGHEGFKGLPIEVRVDHQPSRDAALISDENTDLRVQLRLAEVIVKYMETCRGIINLGEKKDEASQ